MRPQHWTPALDPSARVQLNLPARARAELSWPSGPVSCPIVDVQRKVTSFVTRGGGPCAELCVFWHAASGIQLPAGTVEDGESYETAARREAVEETGLNDLQLVNDLGIRTYAAAPNRAWVTHTTNLRTRPGIAAPVTSWSIGRTAVAVVTRADGYARVIYEESDLDSPEHLVYARLEGWIPEKYLTTTQERAFF